MPLPMSPVLLQELCLGTGTATPKLISTCPGQTVKYSSWDVQFQTEPERKGSERKEKEKKRKKEEAPALLRLNLTTIYITLLGQLGRLLPSFSLLPEPGSP